MAALGTTVGASSLWCWCCGERGCPEGKLLGPSGADNERSSLKEDVLAERALPRKAIRAWLPREVQGYNSCAWLELGSRGIVSNGQTPTAPEDMASCRSS
eukprot:1149495-Pelagomonas_calceolata.AAC.13